MVTGAGYSSLTRLETHPVHVVKIDKAFVERLGDGGRESPMAGAIISLARCLGVHVSADGGEHATQATRLHELGCEYAQGAYFATPRPGETIAPLLAPGGLTDRMARSDTTG